MECVDWARFGLPSPVETGKDGFPRPGKAARCYREQKKRTDATWTQKRLAQELGLTERAVCYLESHDVGLDSISLRRRLAMLFNILPILFGLASLEDEIDPGQAVKRYRKMKPKNHPLRSQKGLARALSITEKAVRDMEKRNIGLDSIARRRVLAHLLALPSAALGIVTLEEVLKQYPATATQALAVMSTQSKVTLDLSTYNDRLKEVYNHYHSSTALDLLVQMSTDMSSLNAALPYASRSGETEIRNTLCRYHQLRASILRDQGRYDAAIEELEKAVILAERAENPRQQAMTLYRLGHVLHDRADVTLAQSKIDAARGNSTGANRKLTLANADYTAAIGHYTSARNLEQSPPALNGILLLGEANAQAHLAHGKQDEIVAALALLKQSRKIIEETKDILENEFSWTMSERSYHNTKAAALLAAGWPREALQELTDLMDLPLEGDMTRQNAYTDYLWSQAYADLGLIDAAATPAQDALAVMKQIKSRVNMMRIAGLQGQLSQLDSKHIEVIRLGVMVNS